MTTRMSNLDESRYIAPQGADNATVGDRRRKQKQLVDAVNGATRAIACSVLAGYAETNASHRRLPLPPPHQGRRAANHQSVIDEEYVDECLSQLQAQVEWISVYVAAAASGNAMGDEHETGNGNDVPSVSFRTSLSRRHSICLRLSESTPRVTTDKLNPLTEVEVPLLLALNTALGNVMVLVNIARDEIEATLRPAVSL